MSYYEIEGIRTAFQKPADMVTRYYLEKLRRMKLKNANRITALPNIIPILQERFLYPDQTIGLFCCDWDGVIKQGYFDGQNGNATQNCKNMDALKSMCSISEKVSIWSSRFHVPELNTTPYARFENLISTNEGISHFPFVTDADLRKLRRTLVEENPKVELDLKFGFSKTLKRANDMAKNIGAVLLEEKPVVIVGSSVIDHIRVLGIIKYCQRHNISIDNLHYFTTGRISW